MNTMIRAIVDFALNSRFVVLSMAILLFIWGIISFHYCPGLYPVR